MCEVAGNNAYVGWSMPYSPKKRRIHAGGMQGGPYVAKFPYMHADASLQGGQLALKKSDLCSGSLGASMKIHPSFRTPQLNVRFSSTVLTETLNS